MIWWIELFIMIFIVIPGFGGLALALLIAFIGICAKVLGSK